MLANQVSTPAKLDISLLREYWILGKTYPIDIIRTLSKDDTHWFCSHYVASTYQSKKKWFWTNTEVAEHSIVYSILVWSSITDTIALSKDTDHIKFTRLFHSFLMSLWGSFIFLILFINFIPIPSSSLSVFSICLVILLTYFIYQYKTHLSNKNRQKIDNIPFEKLYDIQCVSSVLANDFLTPNVSEAFIILNNDIYSSYTIKHLFNWNIWYVYCGFETHINTAQIDEYSTINKSKLLKFKKDILEDF